MLDIVHIFLMQNMWPSPHDRRVRYRIRRQNVVTGYVAQAKYLKGFQPRIAARDGDDFEGAMCWFSWSDSEPPPRGSRSVPLRDGSKA